MKNVCSSGSLGDLIWQLSALRYLYEDGEDLQLFLLPGVEAGWGAGMLHPSGSSRMSQKMAESLLPLLRQQQWLQSVSIYSKEKIDIDLDLIRQESLGIQYDKGHLAHWAAWVFGTAWDFAKPWMEIDSPDWEWENYVVVSRTQRYRNPALDYSFLNTQKLGFIGMRDEYESFLLQCPAAQWIQTADMLEVARVIMACNTFISNQTCAWAISQALGKRNCILEICPQCPNCCTFLPDNYGVITQGGFESVFKKICKEKTKKKMVMLPGGF